MSSLIKNASSVSQNTSEELQIVPKQLLIAKRNKTYTSKQQMNYYVLFWTMQ